MATGTAWSLPPLRTDSVNRGFCISLLTLAIVVLGILIGFFLFFIIPNIDTDCAPNLFPTAHHSTAGTNWELREVESQRRRHDCDEVSAGGCWRGLGGWCGCSGSWPDEGTWLWRIGGPVRTGRREEENAGVRIRNRIQQRSFPIETLQVLSAS